MSLGVYVRSPKSENKYIRELYYHLYRMNHPSERLVQMYEEVDHDMSEMEDKVSTYDEAIENAESEAIEKFAEKIDLILEEKKVWTTKALKERLRELQ